MDVPCRVVVFDLDGTLVDAFKDITAAVNIPLAARGLPVHSLETIRGWVGDGAGKLLERAMPKSTPEEFENMKREMMEFYHEHPADHAFVYTGIPELLQKLKADGIHLAVLSNKPHPMTLKTLDVIGLTHYFDDVSGEDFPRVPRKPHPQGLQEQLARLCATKSLLVGDGIPDGQVAAAAGIPFVGCTWGTRTREQLATTGPVAIAEQVEELYGLIHQVFQQS